MSRALVKMARVSQAGQGACAASPARTRQKDAPANERQDDSQMSPRHRSRRERFRFPTGLIAARRTEHHLPHTHTRWAGSAHSAVPSVHPSTCVCRLSGLEALGRLAPSDSGGSPAALLEGSGHWTCSDRRPSTEHGAYRSSASHDACAAWSMPKASLDRFAQPTGK